MSAALGSVAPIGGASTLTFLERYNEMLDLGIPDWRIAKRMGITFGSLERQLQRHGCSGSALLAKLASEEGAGRRLRCHVPAESAD